MGGASVAVGGSGGAGGSATTVNVTSNSTLYTTGSQSRGISAQSVGGGGGKGGLTIAGTIGSGNTGNLALAVGGAGGKGGDAGDVTVTNHGAVTTLGDKAIAIEAQSIGGGGGNGSMTFAAALSGQDSLDIGVAIGGNGGTSGHGGTVTVTNTGALTTGAASDPVFDDESITDAYGIFAQSIGGTGGNGGLAGALSAQPTGESAPVNVTVAVGGNGGSAGIGGKVVVDNSGAITTISDASHAIFAQSVGGSGGAGGSGFAVSFELTSTQNAGVYNLAFAVGGKGGNGSVGGEVDVTNSGGAINTSGAASHGLYAQSVGGSGGDGGSARTMAYTFNPAFRPPSGSDGFNLQVGIGGNGGTGTTGGAVTVANSAPIHTAGDGSYGIFAQSVGGGGGNGGSASGLPTIPFTDRVKIYKNVVIEVGGKGGSTGDGGKVQVTHTAGDIVTDGYGSPGVVAQSIGGGGGIGGNGAAGATGTVAVGGNGGAAGNGGDVTVAFSGGSIATAGGGAASIDPSSDLDSSYGIFAQSIGGGGGNAGNATFFGLPSAIVGNTASGITVGLGLGIDLAGGNAGNGGTVTVNATGNITTQGPNAVGIFAQSVGGGVSGNLGFSPASEQALIGSAGGNGSGGAVNVTYAGSLATSGGGAHGIFAQSAGASGSGNVTLDITGSVIASGADAHAIYAQSVKLVGLAPGGGGNIGLTIHDGAVIQGGTAGTNNNGAAILLDYGVNNTITSGGTISSVAGIDGYAIVATTGNDTVVNNGHIIGSVDLGSGVNAMNIDGSGRFDSGAAVNMGAGNILNNFGILSPGGDGKALTTALTGNLVQTSGGTYVVTLDGTTVNLNDRIDVSGTADLAGKVSVSLIDPGTGTVQSQTTIIQATGGVSAATAQNLTVDSTAVAQYGLVFSNPQKVDLTYVVDFASPSVLRRLSDNQESIARALADRQRSGRPMKGFGQLLAAGEADDYARMLDALSPESYGVSMVAAALSSEQFNDGLMSCRERSGDLRFIREGDCLRIGLQGRRFDRDNDNDQVGYHIDTGQVSVGAQKALAPDWHAGMGLSYEYWSADADHDLWSSSAQQFQGGLVLKRQIGATLLAASLSGGYADVEVNRNAAPGQQAKGNQDLWFAGSQLRAAHDVEFNDWYLKPRTDLSLAYVYSGSLHESNGGATNLDVDDDRQTFLALQPAIEIGGELDAGDGLLVRPRFSIGLTHFLTDPSPAVSATFSDAPGGAPLKVTSDLDRTTLDLELGVDILSARGINLGLNGFTQIGQDNMQYGGGLRLSLAF